MLVEQTKLATEAISNFVGNASGGEDVKSKILPLRSQLIGIAVDPAQAQTTGKIGNNTAAGADKVIAHAKIHAEIMIFHPADDWLRDGTEVNLIVSTKKSG